MIKQTKKIITLVLSLALVLSLTVSLVPKKAIAKSTATVKSLKVSNILNKTLKMKKGTSYTLKVKLNNSSLGSANTKKKVKFNSLDKSVATVSKLGVIKAKDYGTTTIYVISKQNKAKRVKLKIIVSGKDYVKSIVLNKSKITVSESSDDEITLSVKKIKPSTAKNKDIEWSSSDEDIADIDDDGILVIGHDGTAYLTAMAEDGGGAYATCKVTVTNDPELGDNDNEDYDNDDSEDEDDNDESDD